MRPGKGARARGGVVYNIIHAWRPTHRRSQAEACGRAAGRSADAHPRGPCEARGSRLLGGASEVSGRMGFLKVPTFDARGQATTAHERGARDLRPALRSIRLHAARPSAAPAMRRHRRTSSARSQWSRVRPSPHGFTFRRLPSVTSGKPQDGDRGVLIRAGHTLAQACFGTENGVHPTALLRA